MIAVKESRARKIVTGLWLCSMAAIVLLGCASAPSVARPSAHASSAVTIFVFEAERLPLAGITGADVTGICADGTRIGLGQTHGGNITLVKSELKAHAVRTLLFAQRGYFTGALEIGLPGADGNFYGYDELRIALARRVLL